MSIRYAARLAAEALILLAGMASLLATAVVVTEALR